MSSLGRILGFLILAGISIYTISYGLWTWKRKNRLGAVMLYLLAFFILAIPVYELFFRATGG